MNQSELRALLACCPLLQRHGTEPLEQAALGAPCLLLARDEALHRRAAAARGIYLVVQGCLRIFIATAEGHQFTLGLASRGALIGAHHLDHPQGGGWHAVAREQSLLLPLGEALLRVALGDAALSALSADLAHDDAQQLTERLEDMALHTLDVRLARVLYRLHLRSRANASLRLHRLDQSLIASLAGGTRARVNSHLQSLRRKGAIRIDAGSVVVDRLDVLSREARIGMDGHCS